MKVCTVYYEVGNIRHSIEKDVEVSLIECITYIFKIIESKHHRAKIKTILFSEVNDV